MTRPKKKFVFILRHGQYVFSIQAIYSGAGALCHESEYRWGIAGGLGEGGRGETHC
jgi:hypothetical protein